MADAVSGVISAIGGIADAAKRRKMEQALSLLNSTQQRELNEKILATDDENEKIRILSESMTQYLVENSKASQNKDLYLYIAAGAMAAILLVVIIVYSRQN
jgi:PleD family two-component response regulator